MVRFRSGDLPEVTLREGAGEPLMLLHGITGSAGMWRRVIPLLSPHHDVIAPTALGHRGGSAPRVRPVTIGHVVDDTERLIDGLGFGRVHLAGNSLGGWVALELARRGRALSVCALSPAGAWDGAEQDRERASNKLRKMIILTKTTRSVLPLFAHWSALRHRALHDSAVHGERVSREELIGLADDVLGCEVWDDLLRSSEKLEPLVANCPITLAWARHDRIFPVHVNGERARALVPRARFVILEGVGHVPVLDDPLLVARTILESARAANRAHQDGAPAQTGSAS